MALGAFEEAAGCGRRVGGACQDLRLVRSHMNALPASTFREVEAKLVCSWSVAQMLKFGLRRCSHGRQVLPRTSKPPARCNVESIHLCLAR